MRPELLELHGVEEDAEEQDEVQDEERAELDVVRRERLVRPEEVLAVQAEEDGGIYIRDIYEIYIYGRRKSWQKRPKKIERSMSAACTMVKRDIITMNHTTPERRSRGTISNHQCARGGVIVVVVVVRPG